MSGGSLKNVLYGAAIAATLMLTVALGVGTWLGFRWFTDTQVTSVESDGRVRAKVVRATLFARNELRVGRLSGIVQGVAQSSRLWGWLNSSQVVKAPFTVDYFVGLGRLKPADIGMSRDGQRFLVYAPAVYTDQPNIDIAKTSLNNVTGVFVTRGAYAEMAGMAAASAQRVATAKARAPENVMKSTEFARKAIKRLFEGALHAARVDAKVEVRFPGERPTSNEHWDVSRSIEEVLRDNP